MLPDSAISILLLLLLHQISVVFLSRDILFSYFCQYLLSHLAFSIVPSYRNISQVPVCKIVLTNCSMVINIDSILTSVMFNRKDCSKIDTSYLKNEHLYTLAQMYFKFIP